MLFTRLRKILKLKMCSILITSFIAAQQRKLTKNEENCGLTLKHLNLHYEEKILHLFLCYFTTNLNYALGEKRYFCWENVKLLLCCMTTFVLTQNTANHGIGICSLFFRYVTIRHHF